MKKSLWKNNLKEIIKTRRRFISILIMAFLGVGFFSGLVATGPDIQDSLDKYTDSTKMFDIDIVSTLGLTEEDIGAIKNVEGIEEAYGVQTKDALALCEEKESVCKVIEYNENNTTPVLVSGRLPENSSECLLDQRYSLINNVDYIGKKIVLENEDVDENDNQIFNQKEFTIVGLCNSPIYISGERGNTTIGSGTIDFYIYTKEDVINLEYYTNIYAKVIGAEKALADSDEYWRTVNPVISKVEEIKTQREEARYNQLINEATTKLNDATSEFESKKSEVEAELSDAEKKINDAKQQIEDSEIKLNNSEKDLNNQEANSKKQFENAETQLAEAESKLALKKQELEAGKQELENKKIEANNGIQKINEGIVNAKSSLESLNLQKEYLIQSGLDTTEIDKGINEIENTIANLEGQKSTIELQLKEAENQIIYGETEIANAEAELIKQRNTLNANKKYANTQIANGRVSISNARKELEEARQELAINEIDFQDGKKEAETELNDAQIKLNDAKEDINAIEKAKWYVRSRKDNTGYSNMIDAIKTLTNIAKMFPLIFYLIAVLISLTSMTRMIEEERIEIGTLKALGYTNLQIISKYVLYALLACVIGGFLGMTVGFYLLPNIVWMIYSSIYTIPKFYATYRVGIGILGLVIAFICIGGATILVARKELKNMPSVLMRPKAPKNGKKIILEKITILWKRMNFSQKVTARNIFRYKKRAIMTIVGIAGCTGLMLTGFGIKDSVMDIPESQFGKIFKYETSISLLNTDSLDELKNSLNSNENIENFSEVCASTGKIKKDNSKNYDVTIFVPNSNEDFKEVCNLRDINTSEELNLTNEGIIISSKVADFLNVKSGDTITLIDSDDLEYTFKIDGVAQNYVSHYVYMSKNFYETNMKSYNTNMLLLNTKNMSEKVQNKMSEDILQINGVASVNTISDTMDTIKDMLGSLNYVVIILIVASALLAFVVLYNLANINIGERQREIATLKVLGFYDKEVDNYINKENVIFTIIGVMLGLILGYFLTNMIVASVEIDNLKFIRRILPLSYVYSAVITIIFSAIVNYIIHFVLKKIDMIESLKSVE